MVLTTTFKCKFCVCLCVYISSYTPGYLCSSCPPHINAILSPRTVEKDEVCIILWCCAILCLSYTVDS